MYHVRSRTPSDGLWTSLIHDVELVPCDRIISPDADVEVANAWSYSKVESDYLASCAGRGLVGFYVWHGDQIFLLGRVEHRRWELTKTPVFTALKLTHE